MEERNSLPKFLSILRLRSDIKTILSFLCWREIGFFVYRTNRN